MKDAGKTVSDEVGSSAGVSAMQEQDTEIVSGLVFLNDTAPPEIYTLSLHDALPIWQEPPRAHHGEPRVVRQGSASRVRGARTEADRKSGSAGMPRPISYAAFCL